MKNFITRFKSAYSLYNIKNMYAQYPRTTVALLTGDAVLVVVALVLLGWCVKVLFNV